MLDIDWHGDSYRSVPQLFHLSDSPQPLRKLDGGDAGWAFVAPGASAALASLLEHRRKTKTLTCDSKKMKADLI